MSGSGGQEPDAYGIRPLRPISRSPAIPAHGNGSQLREDDSKDLEILVLRHELLVLPRQRPGAQIDSQRHREMSASDPADTRYLR
jgi:hypothetical protein